VERIKTASEMLGQVKEINQLNEFEHIISFTGKDGLPAYYLDKIFKGSGPAHVAVRKLEKKTGSKRYSVMKYPPAKGKSDFDKKKRDFRKEDISEKLGKDADAGDYVKDFRKSDAPQFKGKSDKKIQKMAIAAYLDSKEEVKEGKRQLKDPKKETMVMKVKDAGSIQVIDKKDLDKFLRKGYIQVEDNIQEENCPDCNEDPCKCKSLQESGHTDVASMKTQVQIATDALQKMNTELGKLSDEEDLPTWWTNKVATAVGKLDGMADYIDAKSDQGQKMNESNLTEEKVFVVRFEKEGMRFAVPFRDMKMAKDGEKILKKSAGVSNLSVTQDILKPGIKLSRTQEGKIVKESKMGELFLDMQMDAQEMSERDFIKTYSKQGFQAAELKRMHKEFNEEVIREENLQEGMNADTAKAILKISLKNKFEVLRGDYVPMLYLSNADRKALKDAGHKMTRDIPKPDFGATVTGILNVANGSSRNHEDAGMYDTETDDMKGKNPAVINMKKFVRGDFQKIGHPKTVGDLVKMTGLRLNSNDPSKNEEVDNSLMAQATRVISHTSIKEKIDPADIDNIATADDRKAADKNIIIQLRRAQDMQGKADVTFKDKPSKKEKIDIRVINKALDMFDKMRPNDKAKMQTMIGKSYRDLLKTVQRGRI